jgi:DNA-binding NtrC family response regulator
MADVPFDATTLAHKVRGGDGYSLRVVGASVERFALPKSGEVVIGRGTDVDVRINDASISRKHALLSLGMRVRIKDLGSTSGTRVADRALVAHEWADVSPGEVVDLGAVMLILTRGDDQDDDAEPAEGGIARAERLLERIAPGDISVLIEGETGVGKEVFAERLHAKSRRADKPLLRLNCGGFTESLLDSELFGHEKGAFTGADRTKPGLLENADGGSVFLDEIGELPMALQARLLRVLQDRKVQRIGALAPRAIDVRFISATNRDLASDVAAGRFRQDLYYRLNGVTLAIPPLRERVAEITPLARRFLADANPKLRLSAAAIARIERHAWPGNIRELKNVIERAALICPVDEVGVAHLQLADAGPTTSAGSLGADVEAVEKARILDALARCGGNQTRAAQQLGIARNTLLARIKQFGIKRPRG